MLIRNLPSASGVEWGGGFFSWADCGCNAKNALCCGPALETHCPRESWLLDLNIVHKLSTRNFLLWTVNKNSDSCEVLKLLFVLAE